MRLWRLAPLLLLAALPMVAGPMQVTVQGNFGPSDNGVSTPFNFQNYLLTFVIPDPATPTSASPPGLPGFALVDYTVVARLSVPGISQTFTAASATAEFVQSNGNWMNLFQFTGLPAGDFLLLTPLQTLNGTPLWNGVSSGPVLTLTSRQAAWAFWRLQQVPAPGQPSIPLAGYQAGTADITIAAVPEPSGWWLAGCGLVLVVAGGRRSRRVTHGWVNAAAKKPSPGSRPGSRWSTGSPATC